MLFAPHGDDALLYGAGVIGQAIRDNDTVVVVAVTDSAVPPRQHPLGTVALNLSLGQIRICEMLNALDLLAQNPKHDPEKVGWSGRVVPVFLGYPDGYLGSVYNAPDDHPVVADYHITGKDEEGNSVEVDRSAYHSQTYGRDKSDFGADTQCNTVTKRNPCACRAVQDWASYYRGVPASYTGNNLRRDVLDVIRYYKPDAVYVPSVKETHEDHVFTFLAVARAVNEIAASGGPAPRVYEAAVHTGSDGNRDAKWPFNFGDGSAYPGDSGKFTAPPYAAYPYGTNQLWEMRGSFDVPDDMRWRAATGRNTIAQSAKHEALRMFCTEWDENGSWYFPRFVKSDEIFWSKEHNIAGSAVVVASSEYSADFVATQAVDGIVDGVGGHDTRTEWAATGTSAAITLTWDRPHLVDRVILYDRVNTTDNITAGEFTFSDGSTMLVSKGSFSSSQTAVFRFAPKNITALSFSISQAEGVYTGLAEIEVYEATNIAALAHASASTSSVYIDPMNRFMPTPMQPNRVVSGSRVPGSWKEKRPSNGGGAGAWLRLNWDHAYTIDRVVLQGHPSGNEWITSGTLTFSDGTYLASGALPNDGTSNVVSFPPKTVNWLEFSVDSGTGSNFEGSEIEVNQSRNIARDAAATASSEYSNDGTPMGANKAIDGVVDGTGGNPGDWTKEWASNGESNTAWIRLTWAKPQRVNRVVLFDRPNLADNVLDGYLSFSDGSMVSVTSLSSTGTAVTFEPKNTSSITLHITSAQGPNIGLSEFEVYEAQ